MFKLNQTKHLDCRKTSKLSNHEGSSSSELVSIFVGSDLMVLMWKNVIVRRVVGRVCSLLNKNDYVAYLLIARIQNGPAVSL